MGYVRNDGKYEIYIIKHLWKDDPTKDQANSGECYQWIPKKIARKHHDKLMYNNGLFTPFTANGECWQRTGIKGGPMYLTTSERIAT